MVQYGSENWALKDIAVANPAAGYESVYFPARGVRQRLFGGVFTLSTSATAATRRVWIGSGGDPTDLPVGICPYTQLASLVVTYGFFASGESTDALIALPSRVFRINPEVYIDLKHACLIYVEGIQAADQIWAIGLRVVEAIMPAEL